MLIVNFIGSTQSEQGFHVKIDICDIFDTCDMTKVTYI